MQTCPHLQGIAHMLSTSLRSDLANWKIALENNKVVLRIGVMFGDLYAMRFLWPSLRILRDLSWICFSHRCKSSGLRRAKGRWVCRFSSINLSLHISSIDWWKGTCTGNHGFSMFLALNLGFPHASTGFQFRFFPFNALVRDAHSRTPDAEGHHPTGDSDHLGCCRRSSRSLLHLTGKRSHRSPNQW